MTKISTLHDAIISKITTNLSSYTKFANAYILERNPKTLLKKGFGVSIGPGVRTDRIIGCQVSWERLFQIVLVNQIHTTENNATVKETAMKAILEDHYTLLTKFEIDGGLSGNAIDGIVSSDGGVDYLEIDDTPYFVMQIDLSLEYFEDLTSL